MNTIMNCSGCGNWTSFEKAATGKWHNVFFPAKGFVRYFCPRCWHLRRFIGELKTFPAYDILERFFVSSVEYKSFLKTDKVFIDGTEITRWGQPIWELSYHIVSIQEKKYKVTGGDLGYHLEEFKPHTN
jgi:hypothetical protein